MNWSNVVRGCKTLAGKVTENPPVYQVWDKATDTISLVEGFPEGSIVYANVDALQSAIRVAKSKERYGVAWQDSESKAWCLLLIEDGCLIFRVVGGDPSIVPGIFLADGEEHTVDGIEDMVTTKWKLESFWDLPAIFSEVLGISISMAELKRVYGAYRRSDNGEGKIKLNHPLRNDRG